MDKLGDIEVFVNVVKLKGFAVAGKKMGISAASVTSRINRLESSYAVRLLTRTTRQVSLTEEGLAFYQNCLKILAELEIAEENLINRDGELKGSLKISATIDIGKQIVAPVLAEFINDNPNIKAHLNLEDHVVNLIEENYDLAIRFGGLANNRMVAKKLINSHRVMFASPKYLAEYGVPSSPQDLKSHKVLGMSRDDRSLNVWHFEKNSVQTSLELEPVMSSNDGSQVRQWAIQGQGIALKSICDLKDDLEQGRLITLLDDFRPDYTKDRDTDQSNLYVVYPTKNYIPLRVRKFIDLLYQRFNQ